MADRQRCWECIRRRLVCDNGRPRCNRCKTSGIDCTGYGAKKPVQFLEPGVVLSRPRKNKPGANQIGRLIGHAETKTDRTKCPKKEVDLCLVVGPKVDPQLQIGREALSTGLDRQVHGVVRQQFRTEVDDIIEAISYCAKRNLGQMCAALTTPNRGRRYSVLVRRQRIQGKPVLGYNARQSRFDSGTVAPHHDSTGTEPSHSQVLYRL